MGHFSVGDLLALQALIRCLLFMDKITKFLSAAQEESTKRSVQVVASFLTFFLPGLTLGGRVDVRQRMIGTHSATDIRSEAEDFKIRIDKKALTIELFDGGVCLDVDDDVCLNHPIQQAISAAWSQSMFPVEKLDICASFIRADLDAKMIFSVLKIMPSNLQYLQLGGISLSVPALTRILLHPKLAALKILKLCDVEFLQAANNDDNLQSRKENTESSINVGSSPLRKIVCLFLRLEAGVTLDPFLKCLKRAPKLEHFELAMDHNHVYNYGQSRLQSGGVAEIFCQSCFGDFLTAAQQLKTLILEYVPLGTLHLCAMAESLRNSQSLKELCLVDASQDLSTEGRSWVTIADFLRMQTTLHTLSLDGITKESDDTSIILEGLAQNGSIHDLRLRNLPLQLDALSSCLGMNSVVAALSLHSNGFEGISSDVQGTVYSTLLQVLEANTTVKRISWKTGRCARTEVFPKRRKSKTYRCYTHHLPSISLVSTWEVQQQIQWFLMLNQRGIRRIMADVDHSTNEFLKIVLQQQREETQEGFPSGEYDLDCLFYLLSTNPSFIKTS